MRTCRTHTLIIGAGPSGLAAAYRLVEAGIRPVIVEKSLHFGGLMRSIRRGRCIVDLGRKELYARIPEVDALWHDLLGADYRPYPHRVGSLYHGRIIEMSSAFRGVRRGMPLGAFLSGATNLAGAWLLSGVRKPANYEQYWHQRAGGRFARALAQGYWEKFRGQRWSDRPVPDMLAEGQAAPSHSFGAIAHGLKLAARGGPSAQRQWRHPAQGTGQICERLVERLRRAGVDMHFETEVVGMTRGDRAITDVFAAADTHRICYQVDNVVSSLQVEALAALLGDQANQPALERQRVVILVYLFLDEPPRFPHAWLEVNDTGLQSGRITNYAAFGGDMIPPGQTALCVEFFLDGNDVRLGRSEQEWTKAAIAECARSALIDPARIRDAMLVRLDRCNAAASWREAQEDGRRDMLERLRRYRNLYHVYRPGTDWAMFAGLMAAESIVAGERHTFEQRADPTRSYAALSVAA